MNFARALGLVVLISVSAVACNAANEGGADNVSSSEELRALDATEIVGQIPFDSDTPIVHTGTPKYRAFWFDAGVGDKLSISVKAPRTDAHAWLTDDAFKTLAFNDDANADPAEDAGETSDSFIAYKATKAGRYYVVFRGEIDVPASFVVRVDRVAAPPPPPPPPPSDNPFECTGDALGKDQLLLRFAPGQDSLALAVNARYSARTRTCNEQTGCAPWSAPAPVSDGAGLDGVLRKVVLLTRPSSVAIQIAGQADSDSTYDAATGTFGGTYHAPNHDDVPLTGKLANQCVGYWASAATSKTPSGSWTETQYGFKTTFPDAVEQPANPIVDAWACQGDPLTKAETLSRFPAGSDTLPLTPNANRYEFQTRTCNVLKGCSVLTAPKPVVDGSGLDGALRAVELKTNGAAGVNVRIAGQSDSDSTYDITNGTFSGSYHAPNHDDGPVAGTITAECIGWHVMTRTDQDVRGSWVETYWGQRAATPAPLR
jgi:hypothetical protein